MLTLQEARMQEALPRLSVRQSTAAEHLEDPARSSRRREARSLVRRHEQQSKLLVYHLKKMSAAISYYKRS